MTEKLFDAVKANDLEKVKNLVADIRSKYDYAVRMASKYGLEMIKYLVSLGANILSNDDSAVRNASAKGHLQFVQYLVSLGANIRSGNDDAVQSASRNGHLQVFLILVLCFR